MTTTQTQSPCTHQNLDLAQVCFQATDPLRDLRFGAIHGRQRPLGQILPTYEAFVAHFGTRGSCSFALSDLRNDAMHCQMRPYKEILARFRPICHLHLMGPAFWEVLARYEDDCFQTTDPRRFRPISPTFGDDEDLCVLPRTVRPLQPELREFVIKPLVYAGRSGEAMSGGGVAGGGDMSVPGGGGFPFGHLADLIDGEILF